MFPVGVHKVVGTFSCVKIFSCEGSNGGIHHELLMGYPFSCDDRIIVSNSGVCVMGIFCLFHMGGVRHGGLWKVVDIGRCLSEKGGWCL